MIRNEVKVGEQTMSVKNEGFEFQKIRTALCKSL